MNTDCVQFTLRDNDCPVCKKSQFAIGDSVVFRHEGLEIVVEVCKHANRAITIARGIVEQNYGAIASYRRQSYSGVRSKPALETRTPPYLKYYWCHLEEELDACDFCRSNFGFHDVSDAFVKIFFKTVAGCGWNEETEEYDPNVSRFFTENPEVLKDYKSGKICGGCLQREGDKFCVSLKKEISRWLEWKRKEQQELVRVSSLRKLMAEAKRELRKPSRTQDALQSLKKAFEQEATSRK